MIELLRRYMLGGTDPQIESIRKAKEPDQPSGLMGPGGVPWNEGLRDADTVSHIDLLHRDVTQERSGQTLEADKPNGRSDQAQV